jgi:hypothetical protein
MYVNCYICDSYEWSVVPAGKIRWNNGGILTFMPHLWWVGFVCISNIVYLQNQCTLSVYTIFIHLHIIWYIIIWFKCNFYFGDLGVIIFPFTGLLG